MRNGLAMAHSILKPAPRRKWRIFKCDGQWCASSPDLEIKAFQFWSSARAYVLSQGLRASEAKVIPFPRQMRFSDAN